MTHLGFQRNCCCTISCRAEVEGSRKEIIRLTTYVTLLAWNTLILKSLANPNISCLFDFSNARCLDRNSSESRQKSCEPFFLVASFVFKNLH